MHGSIATSRISDEVRRLLGPDALERIESPLDRASGLPNAAYWSQAWFQLEQERIFQRAWVFAGADAQIPNVGDTKPLDIGGIPIMLVRGQDRMVRAFQNVCRHRGAQIISEPCNRKTLTCPYHAWSYGLDGRLRARPHFAGPNQHETFKQGGGTGLDLVEVAVATFYGSIFVNVSGTAEPLSTWMHPVAEELKDFDLSAIRWAGKLDFEVDANWKLVYENYMENYHVFALHPKLLKFAPMEIRGAGEWRGNTFTNGYRFPEMEEGRGAGLPHYPGLSSENQARGVWFLTMPHFAVEVFPDQFTVLVSYPIAPDKTKEELHIFLIGDEAATGEKYRHARRSVFKMWEDLNIEDISILKSMQQGRRCPGYDGGRLSPYWEGPTLGYARKIVELVLAP